MEAKDIKKVQDFCRRKNREVLLARGQIKSNNDPGPWKLKEEPFNGIELVDENDGLTAATITGATPEAAALIGAAPDLLGACRHALEALTDPENIDAQDAVDALERAIAKYTGE